MQTEVESTRAELNPTNLDDGNLGILELGQEDTTFRSLDLVQDQGGFLC